jgi:predicted RNase H-like HicB family nuclease
MSEPRPQAEYVLCVSNEGHPASLVVRRIYPAVPDPDASAQGLLRALDESGESYLFPADLFVPIELPDGAEKAFAEADQLAPHAAGGPGAPERRAVREVPRAVVHAIEIEQEQDGRWIAEVLDLTGTLAYGSTPEEACAKAQALALRVLAERLEHAEEPPDLLSISFQIS